MNRPPTDEVRSAISAFRVAVEEGSGEDFTGLIAATTKLLELAARMKDEKPNERDLDVPRRSAPEDHAIIQSRFPGLYTGHEDDLEAADTWTLMPWNDLGDLYHDVRVVDDLMEAGHEADARWEFRFGFEQHWGEHGLRLLGYLLRSYRH